MTHPSRANREACETYDIDLFQNCGRVIWRLETFGWTSVCEKLPLKVNESSQNTLLSE